MATNTGTAARISALRPVYGQPTAAILTCIKERAGRAFYNMASRVSTMGVQMNEHMSPQDPADALSWRHLPVESNDTGGALIRSFRDIAALVTQLPGDTTTVTVAGNLARRAGARLNILQMLVMPVVAAEAWALIPDPSLMERYAEMRDEAGRQTRDLEARLVAMGIEGDIHKLEALYSSPAALAAAAARRTDLVVMTRPGGSAGDASIAHAYFAGILFESGRPVVVLPEGTQARLPPRHAIVAWADTAEASRAVHDALPLLEAAEAVDVVVVDAAKRGMEPSVGTAESAVAHLRAHGVRSNLVTCSSHGSSVGHALLDQASRRRAQLIVAGGYGHGRIREWALGGTTRELFLDATIPVLFSH